MTHKIYIVGIEGAGTSALAQIYRSRGYEVVGSDEGDGFYREGLKNVGIKVHTEFAIGNITDDISFAVHSTAYDHMHIEVRTLHERAIQVFSYPEAIGLLTREMKTIAVSGTHGKTTTTGMLGHAMIAAGSDPTVLVGAPVKGWGGGARTGSDDLFIVEADEYQNKLRHYTPHGIIVTSIDYDHPDFFADEDAYRQVFVDFIGSVPEDGFVVACGDDDDVRKAVEQARCPVIFYGTSNGNDVHIHERKIVDNMQHISFVYQDDRHEMMIGQIGVHNALNAVAAWSAAYTDTIQKQDKIIDGIRRYEGVARRLEIRGLYRGALLIDDYAHHPAEIVTTLAGLKEAYEKRRIVAAFHPHTFTRTAALFSGFTNSFDDADEVIVLDIYGSARETVGEVTAEGLVQGINDISPGKARHVSNIEDLVLWVRKNISGDTLFVTLGAGDIYKAHTLLQV